MNQNIVQTTNRNGSESYSSMRILRHKNPLIIIPFFAGTKEEKIVQEMMKNYNPSLIIRLFKSQVTRESLEEIINGKTQLQQTDN